MALPPQVAALLRECPCLSLAFCDADGPWAASLFFAADEDATLYFTSSPKSRHGGLQNGAAVAATINPTPSHWRDIRGIQCRGEISRLPDDETASARSIYLRKFEDISRLIENPATDDEKKIASAFFKNTFYALRPSLVRLIDNGGGFATRRQFLRTGATWVEQSS